jgi:hypothetical protein
MDSICKTCDICKSVNGNSLLRCSKVCDQCIQYQLRHTPTLSSKGLDLPYYNRHPYLPDPRFIKFAESQMVTPRVCGPVIYAEYIDQYNAYSNCQICQLKGECWSSERHQCVTCPKKQMQVSCGKQYGCQNAYGPIFPSTGPINPMYTNCQKCWAKK